MQRLYDAQRPLEEHTEVELFTIPLHENELQFGPKKPIAQTRVGCWVVISSVGKCVVVVGAIVLGDVVGAIVVLVGVTVVEASIVDVTVVGANVVE